jgi:hypothetical protein
MTALFTRISYQPLLIAAFAISFSALSTPSFAWTAETRQTCTGDAWRLCSSTIPNIGATEACMKRQRTSLSDGCRMAVDKELAAQRTPSVAAK